jgi:hypothetical protein
MISPTAINNHSHPIERFFVLDVKLRGKFLKQFTNTRRRPRTPIFELGYSISICKIESATLCRLRIIHLAQLIRASAEGMPFLHATSKCDSLHWKLFQHFVHRVKLIRNVNVKDFISFLINLITGNSNHRANFTSQVFQREQSSGLLLITTKSLKHQRVLALSINCKCRDDDRSQSSNTAKPRRPIRRGQRRPAYPVIATQRQRASQNHCTKFVNSRFEELNYFFHKEIVA